MAVGDDDVVAEVIGVKVEVVAVVAWVVAFPVDELVVLVLVLARAPVPVPELAFAVELVVVVVAVVVVEGRS